MGVTRAYDIGPFRLDSEAGVLTRNGAPMALGARAVAVLTTLVGRPHQYVPRADIIDTAWAGVVVEEGNLAVQISALRRALSQAPGGERWIETLSGRGYRFVGPVTELPDEAHDGSRGKRSNLPEPLTSFVGRERELVEIKRLLPGKRLLTIVGVGGIGKTRLALQAAAEVADAYRDGVWLIELASISNPLLVSTSVAQVLEIGERAGASLADALCAHLKPRQLLLILDNCEHLLGACATLADAVLRSAADATIIATSREPLHVAGEQTYSLQTLSLPEPSASAESAERSEAVQLFVERARRQVPDFALTTARAPAIAQMCIHLDGIPLALELAAARTRSLSVDQINARLHDRFKLLTSPIRTALPRQQTLRATLDWSYDLLAGEERLLLQRLSVFAGGWTLEAAEQVCVGDTFEKCDVLDLLTSLSDKSLVIAEQKDGYARYRLLETMRQYAQEKLVESRGGDTVQGRHRDYFLALAEEAEPKLMGSEQATWLQRLEEEHENLRAALDRSLDDAGSDAGLRLCGALQRFWTVRGHVSEGRDWCKRVLANWGGQEQTEERAKALSSAGRLAFYQCDFPEARALQEESLAIRRQMGNRGGISASLNNLGSVLYNEGDYVAAWAAHKESLEIKRELGDRWGMGASLNNLGNVDLIRGNLASARALYAECLAIMRELGDREAMAAALNNLGDVLNREGDHASARTLLRECLAIDRDLGDRYGTASTLFALGDVDAEQGDCRAARALYVESMAIRRDLGDRRGVAFAMEGLAAVVAALGSPMRAARIWGAAEQLREVIGVPQLPSERPRYDRRVAAVRAAVGNDVAFARAWQEGRALTMEQGIELALSEAVART
jgi:non-specific serine/threonine protein kinase